MAESPLDRFGKRVQERRKAAGLTQEELAERAEISRSYLSQIEQGRARNLSLRLAETLSTILGIDIDTDALEQDGVSIDLDALDEALEETSMSLPSSLKRFARKQDLPERDVRMLAGLEYRGNRPETEEEWRLLYNVIKSTLDRS